MNIKLLLDKIRAATAISGAISERQSPNRADFDALGLSKEYTDYVQNQRLL